MSRLLLSVRNNLHATDHNIYLSVDFAYFSTGVAYLSVDFTYFSTGVAHLPVDFAYFSAGVAYHSLYLFKLFVADLQ